MKTLMRLSAMTLVVMLNMAAGARADDYPSKTIRIIISYPAGGSTDVLARNLAQTLQESMKQPVVVDNRPGGGFNIAAVTAAHAAPDGYTLFLAYDQSFSLNPLIYSPLPYDPDKDFVPISVVAQQSDFFVAAQSAPGKTFEDLIAFAKANPGRVTYGASSQVAHLIGEEIKLATGVDMLYVPFKGSPDMLQALLSGEIDTSVTGILPYATYVPQHRLYGLGVTGEARETRMPDVPTLRELGYPDLEMRQWFGLFAPAGTPEPILAKLHAEVVKAVADPVLRERLVTSGIDPASSTPEELRAIAKKGLKTWEKVINATGIKLVN